MCELLSLDTVHTFQSLRDYTHMINTTVIRNKCGGEEEENIGI